MGNERDGERKESVVGSRVNVCVFCLLNNGCI